MSKQRAAANPVVSLLAGRTLALKSHFSGGVPGHGRRAECHRPRTYSAGLRTRDIAFDNWSHFDCSATSCLRPDLVSV